MTRARNAKKKKKEKWKMRRWMIRKGKWKAGMEMEAAGGQWLGIGEHGWNEEGDERGVRVRRTGTRARRLA